MRQGKKIMVENSATVYDREYYHKHHSGLLDLNLEQVPSFKLIKRWLNLESGDLVLDAGSGIGYLLDYVSIPEARGIGVDFSLVALRSAIDRYPDLNFVNGNLLDLSFKDDSFDKIFCFNVIEHLKEQDPLVRELYRVLKVGGILVIGTNMKYAICNLIYKLFIRDHTHEKEITVSQFSQLIGSYFRITEVEKSSCVTRFSDSINSIFHRFLRADVIIQARK
jgi:ubiquinone/menaquinone biosynthesis C-methylase UbiE